MIKPFSSSNPQKQDLPDLSSGSNFPQKKSSRVPLWQALVLPVAAILIFFLLLEGGLALLGVKPALQTEDPFVGFASNVPLFIPSPGSGGRNFLVTAPNKLNSFNWQSFPMEKAPGTYRIFCLGGSTTYGRPYDDTTSFSAWLRELLPMADRTRKWEVINAGGISYASYRVAFLMEELINYQPDLFIIYTGHNEFLEERTYRKMRNIPPLIRTTVSLLARTRTWSAMETALQDMGIYPQVNNAKRDQLAGEVDTILDRSAGPERYNRDDTLKENILAHYRLSLERMTALARSVGAQVIFVTPAANLKDCTPFKSEHTQDLDPASRQQAEQILISAKEAISRKNWSEALTLLEAAVYLDPRNAELQYRRGQVLLALNRYKEAETALQLASDEDVCPLRALTPIRDITAEVAKEQEVELVDYADLLAKRMQEKKGYPIPGEEFFLDHVHPTIEGHKILAIALIQAMIGKGIVHPGAEWGEEAIASVAAKIESRIDQEAHARALASLARVLLWAGKTEDAARLSRQALDTGGEYRQVAVDATSILVSVLQRQKNPEQAIKMLYEGIGKAPGAIELRFKLGQALLNKPFPQLEEAAANLLLVTQQLPHFDKPFAFFGMAMVKRGRPLIAYSNLMEALRLNPNNILARDTLAQIQPLVKGLPLNPKPAEIILDIYPSIAPWKLLQGRRDSKGHIMPDGIDVEFYENGRIKRFLDVSQGEPNGLAMTWDAEGKLISRVVYQHGKVITGGPVEKDFNPGN